MKKITYLLESNKEIELVNETWLYDVAEDYFTKAAYIKRARKLTERANKEYKANYAWQELFGEPKDIGWRYCTDCDEFYWKDDGCSCDE